MTGVPLRCQVGHQWQIMAGTPCDDCPACGRVGGFDPSARTHLPGRYTSDYKFIPDQHEAAEAALWGFHEQRVEQTKRIIRLLETIDGRRKFPSLFTQPKWTPPEDDSLTCCETGECAGWGGD